MDKSEKLKADFEIKILQLKLLHAKNDLKLQTFKYKNEIDKINQKYKVQKTLRRKPLQKPQKKNANESTNVGQKVGKENSKFLKKIEKHNDESTYDEYIDDDFEFLSDLQSDIIF